MGPDEENEANEPSEDTSGGAEEKGEDGDDDKDGGERNNFDSSPEEAQVWKEADIDLTSLAAKLSSMLASYGQRSTSSVPLVPQLESLREDYAKLEEEGYADLSPDGYTYNIILKALLMSGERGASEQANRMLQRMEESYRNGDNTRLKPDLLTYNTVLDAFAKEGDAKSAEGLLAKMLGSDDVDPNAHSYTAVRSFFALTPDTAVLSSERLVLTRRFVASIRRSFRHGRRVKTKLRR